MMMYEVVWEDGVTLLQLSFTLREMKRSSYLEEAVIVTKFLGIRRRKRVITDGQTLFHSYLVLINTILS